MGEILENSAKIIRKVIEIFLKILVIYKRTNFSKVYKTSDKDW